MLNYLWAGMTLTGILWGALYGQMTAVTDGAIQASKEAVTLCVTMLGVMTLWTGVLEIGHRSGLVDQLAGRMGPILTFLFPRLDPDGEARKQISVNMIANILGLGWAATPAGLKAMEELKKVEEERRKGGAAGRKDTPGQEETAGQRAAARQAGTASNEMCTFLIINISSLQLIPMNMIAYRSQYGSVNPTAIVGPALAATFISTVVAVIFCRVMDR
ncbi:nucleoside recognition protein [Enterocloster clostridioformis]|uniref:nucleoside recognition protein n=1 Tax=Enterocloster clostridioformis TaxID=1531 RepID=UPI00080C4694|nr:nucleoside recognition protein [Enterocloster clostridioformis]ANU47092.1 nucleoside recognition protein [Lachnoclostridium sp. YL32]NDO32673.1 nucleoside recognition protein [Enterocloster clostridioformis]OXE62933.1 nucleoside recognition protein [Enterocloster clostridioformis]QQQ98198.1 nucleoside recognition protein [Enterocloster clostridioformis]